MQASNAIGWGLAVVLAALTCTCNAIIGIEDVHPKEDAGPSCSPDDCPGQDELCQ